MMETRKKIIIYGGIVLILLLAFLIAVLLFRKKTVAPPVVVETPTSTVDVPVLPDAPVFVPTQIKNLPPAPAPANDEEREKLYVKQLSRTFVERMETSSNQNKNRNINDVLPLATDAMAGYIKTKMQEQSTDYKGVTTKVISMDLSAFTSTAATVAIGAQQSFDDTKNSEVKYKNGKVELKKIGTEWKVSGVYWDP